MSALRIVIVDDHPVFRDGLRAALHTQVDVVAEAGTVEEAVAAVEDHRPDAVLMDLNLGAGSGLEATRSIAAAHPDVAVLALTMSDDHPTVLAALRAGARGYLLKEATAADIVRGLTAVCRGEAVLGARVAEGVIGALQQAGPAAVPVFRHLSGREHEILDLLARGLDNRAIAARLFVSEKTVRNNVSAILTKLPAATRAEAVARARDAGLGR